MPYYWDSFDCEIQCEELIPDGWEAQMEYEAMSDEEKEAFWNHEA